MFTKLRLTYTLEEWTAIKILKGWQTNILLLLGLKTIPKYNFFELLGFAVEKTLNRNLTEFLTNYEDLQADYQEYLTNQKNKPIVINKTIWNKYLASSPQKRVIANLNLEELINKQIQQILGNYQPRAEEEQKEAVTGQISQQSSSSSRYDNLFANLSSEDAERQRKKLEREEAKKKLDEAEFARQQTNLSEKDRKLQEQATRREQEKALQEQKDQKKQAAEKQRTKILQEEQEAHLQTKLENIEKRKKASEQALENQKRTNELEEQKKRNEITKLEKENQQEQERLVKQTEFIEEEKQKKLAAIALEDKEQRQLIEKRANEEKARIESEINEKKRQNEEELTKKENQLKRERDEKKIELDKLQKDIDLQRTLGEEAKRLEQERILKEQKGLTNQLEAFRESLWQAVLNYYWVSSEAKAGTRNPNLNQSGHLKEWLQTYPNMQFNLNFGDIVNNVNWSGYKTAMQAFYRTAGNTFVTQDEFKRLLEQKVKSLDFLN